MSEATTQQESRFDHDLVIVGGGPAGCSAGIFTARYGLETAIFDRGRSSLQRLAHLENYPGFPGGIDIETFYDLLHDHAEAAGCTIVPDLVETIEQDGSGFAIEPQGGERVTARRVIAATRYDGEYLRGLGDEEAMFERYEHDGEEHERFDRAYPEMDGTTPVDGLYVASPSAEADEQVVIAAGRGGRVAKRLIRDVRLEDEGFWEEVVEHHRDWVFLEEGYRDGDWEERIREHFRETIPEGSDHSSAKLERLEDQHVDEKLSQLISREEQAERRVEGQRALATRLDDDVLRAELDARGLLRAEAVADGNTSE
ncbi:NAD(P)/FAD-dependent oxidoreductase [Natrarchaeobius sp. A-rgal3]|uniref:NAD(P)/FAD-dependent oxidoreductase n=1 Tax=Natrarchaeobius versutus TaxID=1679078 RepID=UPI00350EE558